MIEINRLVDVDDWRYVESKNMIADVGTRKGMKVEDVGPNSEWINGLSWMKGEECNFPVKTVSEIVLGSEGRNEAKKETIVIDIINELNDGCAYNNAYMPSHLVPDDVGSRYKYSQYLIDPNRFRYRKVVRVLGLVILFVSKLFARSKGALLTITQYKWEGELPNILLYKGDRYLVTTGKKTDCAIECRGGLVVDLPKNMIDAAMGYFFKKATNEVKRFLPESKYKSISEEKNGVLFYVGRILPTQEIGGKLSLCDTSFDLSNSTFCVPIIDSRSPIAYAIADETHWYHPDVKHGGVESVLRQVQCVAYIIGEEN